MTASRSVRALAVLSILLLAACSGGDDDASPGHSSTTTGASGSSSTTTVIFTGEADSEFCVLLAESEEQPVLDPFEAGLGPREVELRFRALELRFAELAEVAPPDLEADIDGLVTALEDLGSELEGAGYDFAALAESGADVSAFDDESFAESAARVDAYRQQVCS